jgi:predicted transposase/invertase (TIGR01784 family)
MDYNKIEDSIMKNAMDIFKQSAVNFFNLKTKIIAPANTELKDVSIKTNFTDYTFYTEDGNYLHFEFQTTYKEEDINRFLFYDASLLYKHNIKVNTIVVYSSNIKKSKTKLDGGSLKYEIQTFYMSSLDGDKKYSELKSKIEAGKELTNEEILSLTFLPLMSGKEDKSARTIKSIELASKIKENNNKLQCLSLLYALLEKFGDIKSREKFKEVFSMTEIGKMIREEGIREGIQEGKLKGIQEGKLEGKSEILIKQLIKKFKKVPNQYIEKIKTLTPDIIDILALEIFDMQDIKDLEKYL